VIIAENARVPPNAAQQAEAAVAADAVEAGAPTPMNASGVHAPIRQGSPGRDAGSGSSPAVVENEDDELREVTIARVTQAGSEDIPPVLRSGVALELQITDGPLEGTMVTVGEEGARIGRHTSNTLVIPEAGISRYHCEICYIDGNFMVRDLGSTTGTFFYLRPHGHFLMFAGLMVKLGETEMQVLSQTRSDAEDPDQVVLFYEGPLAGHKVHVPATGITIGRRHNNSLVLVQDGTVSAHHAAIFMEEGYFFLTDLGSCNGTCIRLSMERADSGWHPLMDGDTIGAGCTKIQCRISN